MKNALAMLTGSHWDFRSASDIILVNKQALLFCRGQRSKEKAQETESQVTTQ